MGAKLFTNCVFWYSLINFLYEAQLFVESNDKHQQWLSPGSGISKLLGPAVEPPASTGSVPLLCEVSPFQFLIFKESPSWITSTIV